MQIIRRNIYGATYGRDFSPNFFSLENRKKRLKKLSVVQNTLLIHFDFFSTMQTIRRTIYSAIYANDVSTQKQL